jgi:hypothetical protein
VQAENNTDTNVTYAGSRGGARPAIEAKPLFAKHDAIGAFRWMANRVRGGLVVESLDIDGPLGPITKRDGALPDRRGVWSRDTVVPQEIRDGIIEMNRYTVAAGMTGGSGTRGSALIGVPEIWVWGSEGAERYDPRVREVQATPGYEEIAPRVARIIDAIDDRLRTMGQLAVVGDIDGKVISEPKGGATHTFHVPYVDSEEARDTARRRVADLFREAAEAEGFSLQTESGTPGVQWAMDPATGERIEFLDDRTNRSMTIRPDGVSKATAIAASFDTIGEIYEEPVRGAIFYGDGKTDQQAIEGAKEYAAECTRHGRAFDFLGVATVTSRGLDFELAKAADVVVLGAGITQEWLQTHVQNGIDALIAIGEGVDVFADLSGEDADQLRIDMDMVTVFDELHIDWDELVPITDLFHEASKVLPLRQQKDFEVRPAAEIGGDLAREVEAGREGVGPARDAL